jgi:hypothetical protein
MSILKSPPWGGPTRNTQRPVNKSRRRNTLTCVTGVRFDGTEDEGVKCVGMVNTAEVGIGGTATTPANVSIAWANGAGGVSVAQHVQALNLKVAERLNSIVNILSRPVRDLKEARLVQHAMAQGKRNPVNLKARPTGVARQLSVSRTRRR